MTENRTYDDVALPYVGKTNRAQPGWLSNDKVVAPFTLIFSLRFLVPEKDVRTVDKMPNQRSVVYPKPIRGFREKRLFAPVRTANGIIVTVIWWRYIGERDYYQARRICARHLDFLYPRIVDPVRPIVSLRVHLVDWNLGYAAPPRLLRDKWYSERTFANTKVDTFNLKAWGIAGSAPITDEDGELRYGKQDSLLHRWEDRRDRPAVDPLVDDLGIKPDVLARKTLDAYLEELEPKLGTMLAAAKRLAPNIARIRARQAMLVLRSRPFGQQTVDRLYSIYIETADQPGSTAARIRTLTSNLREWLEKTVENRYLR